MNIEQKTTITLTKEDLFEYIKQKKGMNIGDAEIEIQIMRENSMEEFYGRILYSLGPISW